MPEQTSMPLSTQGPCPIGGRRNARSDSIGVDGWRQLSNSEFRTTLEQLGSTPGSAAYIARHRDKPEIADLIARILSGAATTGDAELPQALGPRPEHGEPLAPAMGPAEASASVRGFARAKERLPHDSPASTPSSTTGFMEP